MWCSKSSWIFWSVFFWCTLSEFKRCKHERFKQSFLSYEAGHCHQFRLLQCVAGPAHWKEVFPVANGDRQSPIDIKTEETKYDPSLRPLNPSYDPASAKIILNNGHSTSVEFDDTVNKSGLFLSCCTVVFFHHFLNRSHTAWACLTTEYELLINNKALLLQMRDSFFPCLSAWYNVGTYVDTSLRLRFSESARIPFSQGWFDPPQPAR